MCLSTGEMIKLTSGNSANLFSINQILNLGHKSVVSFQSAGYKISPVSEENSVLCVQRGSQVSMLHLFQSWLLDLHRAPNQF